MPQGHKALASSRDGSIWMGLEKECPWRKTLVEWGWLLPSKWRRGMRKQGDLLCSVSLLRRWARCSSCSFAFVSSTCCFGELVFFFFLGHAYTKQKVSKEVLKIKKFRKKNTLFYSTWNIFTRVLKTGRLRGPSLFYLKMTLLGQSSVPHRHVNVYPLGRGHPLMEVQSLFLVSRWLAPSFLRSTCRFQSV